MSKRPLYDKLLVKADPVTEKSAGGIFLPKDNGTTRTGVVTSVGEGIRLKDDSIRPLTVKVGDIVMMDKDDGYEINVDGEKMILLRESEIHCILGGDDE